MVYIVGILIAVIVVFIISGILTDLIYKKIKSPDFERIFETEKDHLHKMNFYRTYGVIDEDMKMLGHLHVFNCSCGAKKVDLQLTTKPL